MFRCVGPAVPVFPGDLDQGAPSKGLAQAALMQARGFSGRVRHCLQTAVPDHTAAASLQQECTNCIYC